METITFSIDENGNTTFLVNELTNSFVNETSIVRRASHVEPWNPLLRAVFHTLRLFGDKTAIADWTRKWTCRWRVNLSPVNGPILPIEFANRSTAIQFEVDWLTENFL